MTIREEIKSSFANLVFITLAQLISASGGAFNTVETKKIPSESMHSMITLKVDQVNDRVPTMIWQRKRDVHLVGYGPVAFLLLLAARGLYM